MPHKPYVTIANLPTDVLSRIIRQLKVKLGHRDRTLDHIANLRSVCRSLRHSVDLTVTHANFHPHIDVEALRSMTRRCAG